MEAAFKSAIADSFSLAYSAPAGNHTLLFCRFCVCNATLFLFITCILICIMYPMLYYIYNYNILLIYTVYLVWFWLLCVPHCSQLRTAPYSCLSLSSFPINIVKRCAKRSFIQQLWLLHLSVCITRENCPTTRKITWSLRYISSMHFSLALSTRTCTWKKKAFCTILLYFFRDREKERERESYIHLLSSHEREQRVSM